MPLKTQPSKIHIFFPRLSHLKSQLFISGRRFNFCKIKRCFCKKRKNKINIIYYYYLFIYLLKGYRKQLHTFWVSFLFVFKYSFPTLHFNFQVYNISYYSSRNGCERNIATCVAQFWIRITTVLNNFIELNSQYMVIICLQTQILS